MLPWKRHQKHKNWTKNVQMGLDGGKKLQHNQGNSHKSRQWPTEYRIFYRREYSQTNHLLRDWCSNRNNEHIKYTDKTKIRLTRKKSKDLKRHFSTQEIWTANRYTIKKNHCHQSTCICQPKPHEMSADTCYRLITTTTETYSNNMRCQGIERWMNPCTLLEQKWPRTIEQYGGFSNDTSRTAIWSTNAGNISARTEIWVLKRHYHLRVHFCIIHGR